ncbi:putative ribonuclease H-like domain-containing protein [Tanacetum coccineum]
MSYLSDFKAFDGGYVTFGGGVKGGRITGKGTLKTATKDETSGILKSFITEIENLVDKKVKVIRCDNGTKFKNRVMSEFYEKKGIKREYSNTVLVVKPHNKTPYELVRGRTLALSFMRPFGHHVTILNTLDHLGKFDGKSDDGFFVRYSLNSKAFRVYSIRTRKIEESLHIKFLEDKPIIAGDRPKWLFDIDVLTQSMNYVLVVAGTNSNDFAGTKESFGAGHSNKETRSSQDYIVMPLWKDDSLFDSSSKNASDAEPQPSSDIEKKDDEGVSKDSGLDDQERPANNTQDDNDVGPSINTASTNVNTGSSNINIVNPKVTTAPIEATYDDLSGYETEVDMSNITTTYPVSSTPNTRIHKDHSLAQVIGDIQSGVLTRGMTKTTNDQGFISAIYEGKTHEDLHTCLFAYFLSQEEPKRTAKSLSDSAWVEAMQEELLQFKLQQGYTQEEGIDYDEVFAPVARIEAIRLFLAYASFMGFMVYQMDVKSAFLYGKIEEEVYVCQPLGFEDPDNPDKVYKVVKALYGLHQAPRAWTASTSMDTEKPLLKDLDGDDVDVHLYRSLIRSLMYLTLSRPDIMFACKKQTVVATSSTEAEYVAAASCCRQDKQSSMIGIGDTISGVLSLEELRDIVSSKTEREMCDIKTDRVNCTLISPSQSMANLEFCDKHNMVAYLQKSEGSEEQFWQTATASTLENGDMEITATIDGKVKVVFEASIRRHLKLEDFDASKGYTGMDTPLFQTMLVQADEAASTGVDVRNGGAATTVSSLDTGQSSGNIDKTPAMPYDSPLPRVHTFRSDKGRMQHNKLMDLVTKLSDRVVSLETDLQQTKKVYGAAYTKLIKKVKRLEDKLNKSRRKRRLMGAQTQGRHDHEMEADFEFTIAKDVSTANVPVSTTSAEISTASPKVKTAGVSVDDVAAKGLVYIRRSATKRKDKGKAIME